ncbi:hypothetical protein CABS01_07902 [Colletotrichum abscissum]|uniref:Uncharacterized protein n=1 Tax=Colletotrichum abscissum TaxID=1671311 RepID=A0A9P9XPN1_9PEZI|nr:uncharacterized protein CABS01_07902 [Colletotrichum abscissum]KAI3557708.1 hypothetical protein CABS02_01890 [Colletotrichum abscissum]KAK1510230.1 hypothetical protein CABS01_07902 [Colletotrichum abscissum]
MAHKRKRSESELVTLFPSPARSESSIESFESPISPSPIYPRAHATPSHLSSRTMKRFRDNRPSEEQIHQRTLNMLYSAQQHNQYPADAGHETNQSEPTPVPAARNSQKSLHSFWNIKSAEPRCPASAPSVDQSALSPMSCDDCGSGLGVSDGAAGGMDIDDGYSYGVDHSCGACSRHVCSHCSVTNLGEQRRCLRCVGVAAGAARNGSGWPSSSMSIF